MANPERDDELALIVANNTNNHHIELKGEVQEGNISKDADANAEDRNMSDTADKPEEDNRGPDGATTEDSKENTEIAGLGRTDEMAASDNKKTPVVAGNVAQATPMARVAPQHQQQIHIQPYSYNFPHLAFLQNYMPAPTNLTGQASLNPSRYTDAAYIADPVPDTRRNRGGVTEPFPEKLHLMLEATEREGLGDIVGFFSHGRGELK